MIPGVQNKISLFKDSYYFDWFCIFITYDERRVRSFSHS